MTDHQTPYSVRIDAPDAGPLRFIYSPAESNGRTFQYAVTVRDEPGGPAFDWSASPETPAAARTEIAADIRERLAVRGAWVARVGGLVDDVEKWAKELGWATRRIVKRLNDHEVGRHRVPALHMQDDLCRVLLEPQGRTASGIQGVADLYLIPAYDDIASLYFDGRGWQLQYLFQDAGPAWDRFSAVPERLSKEVLAKVLGEMKQHAE